MSSLQEQINQILAARKERLSSVVKEKDFWNKISENFSRFSDAVQAAENQNPSLRNGLAAKTRDAAQKASGIKKKFDQLTNRFNRDEICIGIGGAARMGKSTFLQAVTGLGDDQIPTSDKYFTTAGRSQIVNATEAVAIADMHSEDSFLQKVIAPMCREIGVQAPASLEELKRLKLPKGDTQQEIDVINRLQDTIDNLSSIEKELTGNSHVRIDIKDLRDFVAYPEGGEIKAGKFMAVDDITIYAPFPGREVKQLRVIDLPGLGEAGRNLAEVQTEGMQDVCDATLLMKRPMDANVAWTLNDTTALDAIQSASPLLKDQTKYTAILANVDGDTKDRADACIKDIENQLSKTGRHFEIIRCDARDREAVTNKTMPEILRFLAKNLPDLDKAIFEKTEEEAKKIKTSLKLTLLEVKDALGQVTRNYTGSSYDFQIKLYDKLVKELTEYSEKLQADAEGIDQAWIDEVLRVTGEVKKWIADGCGYSSKQALVQEIEKEIKAVKGYPATVVNQLRIAFREQWEVIDEHLQERIAKVLDGFIETIQKCTNSFIPEREQNTELLPTIRKQLKTTAEKLMNTPDQDPGDEKALSGLATPLRRLADFDIRFRFHLEPTLIAATEMLNSLSEKLPPVKSYHDAKSFTDKMLEILNTTADDYSKAMRQSRTATGNGVLEKNKRLIAGAVKDPNVQNQLIAMLQGAVASSLSFCPNKIFAAVIENAADAFLRFKDHNKAFAVWIKGYASELRETPTPAERAAMNAYTDASDMLKKIQ